MSAAAPASKEAASEEAALCLPLAYKEARRRQGQRDSQDRWQQAVKKNEVFDFIHISNILS